MQHMGPNKAPKILKADIIGLEADSWLYNFTFLNILITRVFEKQVEKRLRLKTQFKIEFCYRLPIVEKWREKCLGYI